MIRTAIVTGATGFIGGALTKKLLQMGIMVYALDIDKQKLDGLKEFGNVEPIQATFEDYSTLHEKIHATDIDVFFHFAWNGTFGESFKNYNLQLKNSIAAGDAAMVAARLGCKKFVLAGTTVELETKKFINMGECEPRYSCIYGSAKMAAEMICKTIAYQHDMDMNTAIIANAFGVGDYSKMVQNVLINQLNNNIQPKLIEGNNLYDWIYIDDIVDAFIAIGNSGKYFQTYYVGHRKLRTFKEIITEVRDMLNPDMKLVFGEYKDPIDLDYSLIDIDLLYKDTGFECKADFRESILKTAEWVKTLQF